MSSASVHPRNDNEVDFDSYYDYGDEGLKQVASPYMRERESEDRQPDPPNYENKIPIGIVKKSSPRSRFSRGDVYWISVQNSDRLGIFGKTGIGKTTFIKTIMSRFVDGGDGAGGHALHVSDVKNDFEDINYGDGVSKKLVNKSAGILKNEQRAPINVKMMIPRYMYDDYATKPRTEQFTTFTYPINKLSESDFTRLLDPSSQSQKNIVNLLYERINNGDLSNLSKMLEFLDDMDANHTSKQSVKMSLKSMKKQGVISGRYQKNPIDVLQKGNVVSIALEHWEKYKGESMEKIELYIAITLRLLNEALRSGDIKPPVLVIVDEAGSMCPADDPESISRDKIVDAVDLGRDYGIPMIFAAQRPSQIPEQDVINQMSHYVIPKTLDPSSRKLLMKKANLHQHADTMTGKWNRVFKRMDKFEKFMINRERNSWAIIDPLAPLCAHTG